MNLINLRRDIKRLADPGKAELLQRFFKTGKGQYGYGDKFVGIMVPQSRNLAKKYSDLSFREIANLLHSKIHEERLIALLMLVHKFNQASGLDKEKIYRFYLKQTKRINNWDLVDLSADKIVGIYLLDKPRKILYQLVRSANVWERRIAILATFQFIKRNQFNDSVKIAEKLLKDRHDLIHKAVGWMLREAGKRNQKILIRFLNQHGRQMPRTMLRYAIERLPNNLKAKYLKL